MMRPGDFVNLFTAETQEQAQAMLTCVIAGILMSLAALPDTEENSMARAYLYAGMSMALRGRGQKCETLNDFFSINGMDTGRFTPEQWHKLQNLWSQLKENGAQGNACMPECAL